MVWLLGVISWQGSEVNNSLGDSDTRAATLTLFKMILIMCGHSFYFCLKITIVTNKTESSNKLRQS